MVLGCADPRPSDSLLADSRSEQRGRAHIFSPGRGRQSVARALNFRSLVRIPRTRTKSASERVVRKERLGHLALAAFVFATMVPRGAPAGTVEEQRARLPPPATCQDPVEGIWTSHDYDPRWEDWTIFSLEVHRTEPDGPLLKGAIKNDTWYGSPQQSDPGPCEGRLRFKVSMDAEGTVVDGKIAFGGVGQWRMDEVICGTWDSGYNLDNFTGIIDPEIQEFQSVNNDGGRAVNDPTVFRRVKCFDDPTEEGPRVVVEPPPFYLPKDEQTGRGCGA